MLVLAFGGIDAGGGRFLCVWGDWGERGGG